MIGIYWNIRGIANSPTRITLKKFILISEPWIDFQSFPQNWFSRLGFKLLAMNYRNNLLPNIWCLCKVNISPSILAISSQHVSFTLSENSKTFAFSAIYALTNYITRRKLWTVLHQLQTQYNLPWCFIGDFNIILGAHEHRVRYPPARTPIKDFGEWTDQNNLLHLPTRGSQFTRANGRGGSRFTGKKA